MRAMTVLSVIAICGAIATAWATFDGWSSTVVYGADAEQEWVSRDLDRRLATILRSADFTGRIEGTLEARLRRRLDRHRADLGRLLFFDNRLGLHEDNWCAGCHSPAFGFGDSQSIAIGVQNNGLVGGDRRGLRNQRKAPVVINSAFFPKLMLNGRFAANSGDPFDTRADTRSHSPRATR
jgi:cytochrome c peroxidase